MKFNKKLIVPFLATVTGLSITGGLGGAFAWYQFNSQVRASYVGTSVADTGVLQIGYDDTGAPGGIKWTSIHSKKDLKFVPVTFGALNADGTLPANAYGYPEAGHQIGTDYTSGWRQMTAGVGYAQYDIYLRALKADSTSAGDPSHDIAPGYKLAAKDVYLSSMTLSDLAHPADDTLIANALRVHLNVAGTNGKKLLISKTAITSTSPLNLFGKMDLDGDGAKDKYFVPASDPNSGQEVLYGIDGQTQVTKGIADVVQARDSSGNMPATANEKLILTTSDGVTPSKITITAWIEGWALLQVDSTAPTALSNVWNPALNSGMQVGFDMVFDVGNNIIG